MASLQSLFIPTITTRTTLPNPTSNRRSKTYPKVSCNATSDDNEKLLILPETQKLILPTTLNVDRRNLLLGLGAGLYSTVNFTSAPAAFADPITTPDISTCVASTKGFQPKNAVRTNACCPPTLSKTVKEFVFPNDRATRIRPAAHRASPEYIAKYKAAIQKMRDLEDDDPHSFVSQAKIHCAYCNGGFTQDKHPDKELQIHNSWLFFPFHRWYLYFYERILGKLIDDPTFAIPYWNWDNPAGMSLPDFFEEGGKANPAFDAYRNSSHLAPAIADLDYDGTEKNYTCIKQLSVNLGAMNKQMIRNAGDWKSFFGGEYRAGSDPIGNKDPSVGSVEAGCHTAIHRWVGNSRLPNGEDMGNFYSAGYDPVFYVHHANVDRMWKVWKDLGIRGHIEPPDNDWRNASYVFYDENKELVRVYNKDCVRLEKLKYDYQFAPIPWKNSRPVARTKKSNIALKSVGTVKQAQDSKFPLKLDKTTKVLVKRPATNRSKEDKENANEVLLIKGVVFNGEKFVKFDVFVNDKDDVTASTAEESEFAGSFAQLPHNHGDKMLMTSSARFGLTELLEDIDAEDDESILVTLVPKVGCEEVTIGEIKVELVPIEE
uniref:Polyphenol oxidase n=2 Tax=Taraxacum officinale TaxID=50225 RepID=I7HUF2_TAROF|nr:polyphenol oxidase precursor [Taraxacum officinale]